MLKFISIVLLSGFCLAQTTHATPPSVESINKLIELNGDTQTCQLVMKESKEKAYKAILTKETALEQKKMNDEGFEQYYQYLSEMRKLTDDYTTCERLKSFLIQLYTETFTQKEVNYLIDTYNNTLLDQILEKLSLKDKKIDNFTQKYIEEIREKEVNLANKYFKSKP